MWILFQLKHQKRVNNVILACQWEFSINCTFSAHQHIFSYLTCKFAKKPGSIQTLNIKFPQIPMKFQKISFRPFTEYNMLLLNSNIYFCYLFLNPEQRLPIRWSDVLLATKPFKICFGKHFHHQRLTNHLRLVLRTIFTTRGVFRTQWNI